MALAPDLRSASIYTTCASPPRADRRFYRWSEHRLCLAGAAPLRLVIGICITVRVAGPHRLGQTSALVTSALGLCGVRRFRSGIECVVVQRSNRILMATCVTNVPYARGPNTGFSAVDVVKGLLAAVFRAVLPPNTRLVAPKP